MKRFMHELPIWFFFECIVLEIQKVYPDANVNEGSQGKDRHNTVYMDYLLGVPSQNKRFNCRVYFPDRVLQRTRLMRICSLLQVPMERLERECGALVTSFQ